MSTIKLSKQQWEKIGQKTGWLDSNIYTYHINLDERGEFYADIRKNDDETVFEIKGSQIFEDGFMKNKKDMVGLKEYLVSHRIMKIIDELKYIG